MYFEILKLKICIKNCAKSIWKEKKKTEKVVNIAMDNIDYNMWFD